MVPEWVWDTEGPAGQAGGHWSPLRREVSLPYHGVALALQIGGQLGVVVNALVGGIGQVHFGEQVAIVLALMYLLCEGSLIQLLPAAALHGGQCMGGGVVVQFHQSWGARLGLTCVRGQGPGRWGALGGNCVLLEAAATLLKTCWDCGRGRE